ncbi:MAG: L,D-transpeptidase family protein, partial [Beijerinckiaceae bacterium]
MVARPFAAAIALFVGLTPAPASETVLRCVTQTDEKVSRLICEPAPVTGDIKVPLPETAEPIVTGAGTGAFAAVALPDPPPPVVIPQQELAVVAPPPAPAAPQPAPEKAEPPIPAPPVVAEALPPMPGEALEGALRRLKADNRLSDRDAEEVLAFYRAREFRPLWLDNGRWGDRALSMRALFAAADEDGLDPARYRTVSAFVQVGEPQWGALAAAEARMTEAVVAYARDAATGRVRPAAVHPLITPNLKPPAAAAILSELVEAQDPASALRSFNPPHPQFARLREALAQARASRPAVAAGEVIPDGPLLRVGMRDPRVPLIRARLGLGYDSTSVYDRAVSVRVAGLQKANGLPVNGAFTPQTRRVLAGEAPTPEEAEIIANMEFWRWMPRELGAEHIFVNTPAYHMHVQRGDAVALEARIIVGKSDTQTPFFSDTMDHIGVNPSWYIPPGILKREPKYLNP